MMLIVLLLLLALSDIICVHHHGIHENNNDGIWNNPILPPGFIDLVSKVPIGTPGTKVPSYPLKEKLITRNLWLGFKHIPSSESELHPHIIEFIGKARNQSWNVHMLGHQEQLNFLETYYPNSSLVWAYQAIHSQVYHHHHHFHHYYYHYCHHPSSSTSSSSLSSSSYRLEYQLVIYGDMLHYMHLEDYTWMMIQTFKQN
jgi:hypothetical protein